MHINCQDDIANLTLDASMAENEPKMSRSDSIASIESIEFDRPLDQIIKKEDFQLEETEIEIKAEDDDERIEENEIKSESTMDIDVKSEIENVKKVF